MSAPEYQDSAREAAPPEGAAPPLDALPADDGDVVVGEAGVDADADAEPAGDGIAEEPIDEAALRERAAKADVYLDLAQRTQADFDNYRKRMAREVRAAEARGISKLARELLPALDNLERAVAAVEAADPDHHLSAGIKLVTAELAAALGRAGIHGYSPAGELFDPNRHEAVAQQPVEGAASGTVVQVLQSGYSLGEAVLRPARVIVAS